MRPSRRVRLLDSTEVSSLDQTYRQTNDADLRTRCQIILLSNEGHSTPEVARLVRFSEDSPPLLATRESFHRLPAQTAGDYSFVDILR